MGVLPPLQLPAALAYGSTERPKIPANSVLQFEIELLEARLLQLPRYPPEEVHTMRVRRKHLVEDVLAAFGGDDTDSDDEGHDAACGRAPARCSQCA